MAKNNMEDNEEGVAWLIGGLVDWLVERLKGLLDAGWFPKEEINFGLNHQIDKDEYEKF